MLKYLLTIVFGLLLASCSNFEEPEFEEIHSLKVHELTDQFVILKGEARFINPNKLSFKVKSIDVDVRKKDKIIGKVNHTEITKVKAKQQFDVPFVLKIPKEELSQGLLNDLIGMLSGRKVKLKFDGILKVSKMGIGKTIPIEYEYEIKM